MTWNFSTMKQQPFELCPFFGAAFSEIKNADILNISLIKYFGNDFAIGIYSSKNCPRHGSGQLPPVSS